ncbi:recombinase family protein [Streptomyces sp. NPDC002896]|uniref:recombinase family protein n=1 Tax=Streptomyces sp. NPDC002896 TaxID=3154438 RepID=UPI00332EACF3
MRTTSAKSGRPSSAVSTCGASTHSIRGSIQSSTPQPHARLHIQGDRTVHPSSKGRSYVRLVSELPQSLVSALETGRTFEEWLGGRIPGLDYARISADQSTRSSVLAKGREAGTGVRHQHEENIEAGAGFGVAIVKCYEDNGITAAHSDVVRPAFVEMVDALHYRRTSEGYPVQALVATEHERVWRLAADCAKLRRAVTVTEDGLFIERRAVFDLHAKDATGDATASEDEVRKTKERIERHIRRRAIDGGTPGGRRRFGWLPPDPRSGRKINMDRDPHEWPVLREMIESALRGASWNDIARGLNSRGITTAAGNRWSGATVRQALTNPVMCGYRAIHGELVRDSATGSPIVGQWDAPATVEEWQMLVELSRQRGAKRGTRLTNGSPPPGKEPKSHRKYLFSGYLRCGATRKDGAPCNAKMGGCARSTEKNPDNAVYVCTALDCSGAARNVPDVDDYLQEIVFSMLDKRHMDARSERQPEWAGTALLRLLVEKHESLEDQRDAGTLPYADGSRKMSDLETRISGLEAAREEHFRAWQASVSGWNRSQWPAMSLTQRRAAIADVLQAVIVLPLPRGRSRRAPFDPRLLQIVPAETP